MARFGFLAIIAIVLAISLQQAIALKCWQCDGENNPNCNDPFDDKKLDPKTSLIDCVPSTPNGPVACTKAIVEMDGKSSVQRACTNKKEAIERGCIEEDVKKGEAALKEASGKDVKLHCVPFCNTDGCNGSVAYGPVALMIAIPVIIMKISSW